MRSWSFDWPMSLFYLGCTCVGMHKEGASKPCPCQPGGVSNTRRLANGLKMRLDSRTRAGQPSQLGQRLEMTTAEVPGPTLQPSDRCHCSSATRRRRRRRRKESGLLLVWMDINKQLTTPIDLETLATVAIAAFGLLASFPLLSAQEAPLQCLLNLNLQSIVQIVPLLFLSFFLPFFALAAMGFLYYLQLPLAWPPQNPLAGW